MKLTPNEEDIMRIFWSNSRSLSRAQILSLASPQKDWKDASLHNILNRLLKKGAICEDGFIQSGNVFGRLFKATLSEKEYYEEITSQTSPSIAFSAAIDHISLETIGELEQMLKKKKDELMKDAGD